MHVKNNLQWGDCKTTIPDVNTVTTKLADKKRRAVMGRTVSFQPTSEVRELLASAKEAGLEISEIINNAIEKKGEGVATQLAEDQVKAGQAFLARRKADKGHKG
jgi:hypothetical protein